MKVGYIDAVLTVWNRCMNDPVARELILWSDTYQAKPIFHSIYQIEAVVRKAGSMDNTRFQWPT